MNDINCITSEEGYFFEYKGHYFRVKSLLFNIFSMKQKGAHSNDIAEYISTEYKFNLTSEEIENIISNQIKRIKKSSYQSNSYIHWKIILINSRNVRAISRKFIFLFQRKTIAILLLFSLIFNLYFLFKVPFVLDFSGNWFIVYAFIFVSGLFHEFGHSAASTKYNIDPGKIGFGFFLIFPVFFSDVTKVWILKKGKRIVVNLSGIYFQLLSVNILIILYILFSAEYGATLNKIIYMNYCMMILSINPYLRNDGYWILSDYTEIPNLAKESYYFPVGLIKNQCRNTFNQKQFFTVALYSIGLYTLIFLFLFYLITSIPNEALQFRKILSCRENAVFIIKENMGFIIKVTLKYFILFTILYKSAKKYAKQTI